MHARNAGDAALCGLYTPDECIYVAMRAGRASPGSIQSV